jgi:hypothetical protein
MYSDDDSESADAKSDDEVCAICALPASNGGHGADARCAGFGELISGCTLSAAPPSVPDALERTLRDALFEASYDTIIGWIDGDELPKQSIQANLRALSAAVLRATAGRGDDSLELTARDVARAVCVGPALVAAAGVLGKARLSAPLSRVVRLALVNCESASVSATTVRASRAEMFSQAVQKLCADGGTDAPITLSVLCSAICAPRVIEVAEAALCGEARDTALACTNGTMHGAGCDCGAVMGGGFL